jgi:DNA repair exonuclease SbcCD ATPase subunit
MWERASHVEAVDKMKARAKVKYKGYKTKIVRKDNGVAIYVENKYNQDKRKADLKEKIEGYEARKEKARLAFEAELERLEDEQDEYIKQFAELENK